MRINVTVHGFDEVRDRFNGIIDRAANVRPLFEVIGESFRERSEEAWRTHGASTGRRWKPLQPDYLRRKIRKGLGSGILENKSPRGGLLRRSLTQRRAKGSLQRITRDSIEMGTNVGIARIHQGGGSVMLRPPHGRPRRVQIPARPFVVVTDRMRQDWSDLAIRHLMDDQPRFNGRV